MCYPAEVNDTPIHKITIRPTEPSDSTQPPSNRSKANINRGRKIENGGTIIKVLKKPSEKETSLTHPKKFESINHTNLADAKPIYFTRAKVNGSFRQSPLNRSRDAKQWRVYKLKPAEKVNLTTLKSDK